MGGRQRIHSASGEDQFMFPFILCSKKRERELPPAPGDAGGAVGRRRGVQSHGGGVRSQGVDGLLGAGRPEGGRCPCGGRTGELISPPHGHALPDEAWRSPAPAAG